MGPARVLVATIVLVLGTSTARADDKPWAAGVPKDQQAAALKLYREGNTLFEQDLYPAALERYQRALADWDHPAIHYNAAVCLIRLDRILEAYDHLDRALRFGDAPLGKDLHAEARGYEKLLARQVGTVEVAVDEPGAEVTLDGQPLFVAPSRVTRRLLTGSHQVVATKEGFVTETRPLTLGPAAREVVTIELVRPAASRRLTRRWPAWKPYAAVGGGALIASLGVPLYFAARGNFDGYDDAIERMPLGTAPDVATLRTLDRARLQRAASYGAFAVGGAVIATGLVLVFANQARLAPVVAPQVDGDRVGLVISGRL